MKRKRLNCEYAATARAAFLEDYYGKLDKAENPSKGGLASIYVLYPCPTCWRFYPGKLSEIACKAVEIFLSLTGKDRYFSKEHIDYFRWGTVKRIRVLKNFIQSGNGDTISDAVSCPF